MKGEELFFEAHSHYEGTLFPLRLNYLPNTTELKSHYHGKEWDLNLSVSQ